MIHSAGATLAGVAIGLDRQERGEGAISAIQEVEQEYNVPVLSIIEMSNIIDYLEAGQSAPQGALSAMRNYREAYGV